jgi:hypothetical protein
LRKLARSTVQLWLIVPTSNLGADSRFASDKRVALGRVMRRRRPRLTWLGLLSNGSGRAQIM